MKRNISAIVIGLTVSLLLSLTVDAQWNAWEYYGWWRPRPVRVTVDTHTFTGTVDSLNSTQMVITVTGRENYKTRIRWENAYTVRPLHKPVTSYSGDDPAAKPSATQPQTFRIAVSCRVLTEKNLHARFSDVHVGDTVTIGHSLDYKNNRVAIEITVTKSH